MISSPCVLAFPRDLRIMVKFKFKKLNIEKILYFSYLCVLMFMCSLSGVCVCVGQRITEGISSFLPSTMWDLEPEVRSSGLVTANAILLALQKFKILAVGFKF